MIEYYYYLGNCFSGQCTSKGHAQTSVDAVLARILNSSLSIDDVWSLWQQWHIRFIIGVSRKTQFEINVEVN